MKIIVQDCNPPIPTNICWEAFIDGQEERYGTAHGRTRREAVENILEAVEMVDEAESEKTTPA